MNSNGSSKPWLIDLSAVHLLQTIGFMEIIKVLFQKVYLHNVGRF